MTFSLLMNEVNLILLLTVTLSFLYGIAGAYQPSVQASIPALKIVFDSFFNPPFFYSVCQNTIYKINNLIWLKTFYGGSYLNLFFTYEWSESHSPFDSDIELYNGNANLIVAFPNKEIIWPMTTNVKSFENSFWFIL